MGKFIPLSKGLRFAVLAGACVVIGGAAWIFFGGPVDQAPPAGKQQSAGKTLPVPWFRKQGPPPAMVRLPDAELPPLLPENSLRSPPAARPRAYEEALPATIHEPTAETLPAPLVEPFDETGGPPPWRRFSVAQAGPPGQGPLIAIVMDDVGIDKKRSARAMALPAPLTIAMLSYAPDIARQAGVARAAGHELLVHVSMEPTSLTVDPGPHVLLSGLPQAEILRRLNWDLGRFSGYVGLNNHMGSHFTADVAGMSVVMAEVKRRGLLFLDSRTTSKSVGGALARRFGVPHAERNIFLDNQATPQAVRQRLAQLEQIAQRQGYAVAIGHPRDATLEVLATWLIDARRRGFVFVPISAIVARRHGISLAEKSGGD